MTDTTLDDIQSLVHNIADKNMIDVEAQFRKIMGDKVTDALDTKRLEVAQSIYGGSPQNDDDDDEHSDEDGSEDVE
jgi:hypothetical protein